MAIPMGAHYDRRACSAMQLAGQNVRGLTDVKQKKEIEFMKDHGIQVICLQETWRVTPASVELMEEQGFLIIHHGQTTKTRRRGLNGVAIILDPETRQRGSSKGASCSTVPTVGR